MEEEPQKEEKYKSVKIKEEKNGNNSSMSDMEFEDENINININNISNKTDSSNIGEKKKDNSNIRKLNLENIDNFRNNDFMTYREKTKYNLKSKREEDKQSQQNKNEINTYRTEKNSEKNELILQKMRNRLPGDFIPKIKEKDKISQHVQIIHPKIKMNKKIRIHTLDNLFSKNYNDNYHKDYLKLKPKTLLDNPYYSYIEDKAKTNVKVHKCFLFDSNLKKKK